MIAAANLDALAEVGFAFLVHAQHYVCATLLQVGDLEKRAEMAVAEHHVSFVNAIMQTPEQRQLACLFSLIRTKGGVEHGADREGKDHQETQDREADAWLLTSHLRVLFLIGRGVRHGSGGTI